MNSWSMGTLDLPIHNVVKQIQSTALYKIYHPRIMQRVQDNEIRLDNVESKFTLNELFETMSSIIWKEVELKEDVNSFRRNLQKEHIKILIHIMLDRENNFPNDAVAFARKNLNKLSVKLNFSINNDYIQLRSGQK